MFTKVVLKCPVGGEPIGYTMKGEAASLVCHDCMFTFTWNEKGKLMKPKKYVKPKQPELCGCGGCQR